MSDAKGRTDRSFLHSSDAGIELEARVGHVETPRGLAIVAHPYGFLGGSLADPVTRAVSELLWQGHEYRTVRFNSRGVGKSGGKGSWTGEAEARDYQAVAEQCIDTFVADYPNTKDCELVIAGYSAGALYASSVRLDDELPVQFSRVSCILISYPLDKIWALSLFHSAAWDKRMTELLSSRRRVLLVQGTTDEFTKDDHYRQWSEKLRKTCSTPELSIQTVEGASHFWAGQGHLQRLLNAVDEFVRTNPQ